MKYIPLALRFTLIVLVMTIAALICSCGNTANSECAVRRNGIYVTYSYQSADFLESIADEKAYGTNVKCTSMQGMESSDKYIYAAKQKSNEYAIIVQYDPESDTQRTMIYYDSLDAPGQTGLDSVSHCNDMAIYTDTDNLQYMLTAATYHPNSSSYACPSMTQLLVDEENAELRLAGFFNLTRIDDNGKSVYISASSVRLIAQTEDYNYFLMKNANDFYWFKIPAGTMGGTRENPVNIPCIHLFNIDNRNAVFVNNSGELETIDNLESWTNQGFFYSVEEDLIYVPLYNEYNGKYANTECVILVFDMDGMLTVDALEAVTANRTLQIYPSTLTFYLNCTTLSQFEVEACVFLKNQGHNGDLTLYFNTNGNKVSKSEGIWELKYIRGSEDIHPVVGVDSVIYTVKYDYNVEGISEDNWTQDNVNNNYSMLRSTTHVAGITTNLRLNRFTRSGYKFIGWHLYRESDGAWLYSDGNWYTEQMAPTEMEKKLLSDAEPVDDLTPINGDIITAHAQWK